MPLHLSFAERSLWHAPPEAVLAYLSRYTHRVAISNSRLVACDDTTVTFRWKDYRARSKGVAWQTMSLAPDDFIRRFLIHVLPRGFHRIRHYGLLAGPTRAATIARIRGLLGAVPPNDGVSPEAEASPPASPCPCCGGRMIVIEILGRVVTSRPGTGSSFKIDTS